MLHRSLFALTVAGMLCSVAPSWAQERDQDQDRDRQRSSSRFQEDDSDRSSQDQFSDDQSSDEQFNRNQSGRDQQSRDLQSNRDRQRRRQQGSYQAGQESWQQQNRFQDQDYGQTRSRSRMDSNQFGWQDQSRGQSSSSDEASLGVTLIQSSREARVASVTQGSPAQRAGLRTGDIILSIDEEPVRSGQDVVSHIGQMDPGSWVEIEILRNGNRRTVETQLASRQETLARGSSQFDQSRMSRSFSDDSSGRFDRGQQYSGQQYSGQQYSQQGDGNLQRQVQNLQRQVSSLEQELRQLRSQVQGGRQTADRRSSQSSQDSYEQESYRDGSSGQRDYREDYQDQ